MWFREPFFKYSVGILLVLLIILLAYYTAPVFSPILWFSAAVLLPILFATLLYYILRPVVGFLNRWLPTYLSILLIYLIIGFLGAIAAYYVGPFLSLEFAKISQEKVEALKASFSNFSERLKQHISPTYLTLIEDMVTTFSIKFNEVVYKQSLNLVTALANITVALILTPFVLFYFLKDDVLFSRSVLRYVPSQFQEEIQKTLTDVDKTLEEFIQSQMIVAFVVGFFVFVGYLFIGLPNALALSFFAVIFYVIPFLGTFLSLIPALFIAIPLGMSMILKTIAVVLLAHLLETNLLTPKIMSKRLNIHPLTIILLLLAAGSLYGIIGLLLVTPTYAIIKVVVWNLYKISKLRYIEAKQAVHTEPASSPNLPP